MAHTNHRSGDTKRRDHHPNYYFRKDCVKDEGDTVRRVNDRALCNGIRRGAVDPDDADFSPSRCSNVFNWD